jgi:tRNA-2-methylthio-N6-dimethylallyladenosine synthase
MPFLHLPVQSGSDGILKAMNRQHTGDFYRRIIDDFRTSQPKIAFSSDFIVGFPGETRQDFAHTLQLVNDVDYAQAFSFSYSIRPGTPAGFLEDQIDPLEKQERLHILQDLLRQQQLRFNKSKENEVMDVLFEKPGKKPNQYIGKSPYLQSVHVFHDKCLIGKSIQVKITQGYQNSLEAEIITPVD